MLVTAVDVWPLRFPVEAPIDEVSAVVALVRTDEGLEGLGHAIPFNAQQFRSLVAAVEELGERLVGADPQQPERVHRLLLPGGTGLGGTGNIAAGVLDIAVWDIAAKAAGLPLYRLLGGYRDRVPVYASLRLRLTLDIPELQDTAAALVADGFRAVKMNVGGQETIAAEVARVAAVREAIGLDIELLADANSRWTPAWAVQVARALADYRLHWLEDPVPIHDLLGLAEVRRAAPMPIATGELLFSLPAFRPLFEARAVDYPMPDLLRIGGITAFRKVAHLAEAFGLPVANHLAPEVSAHVLAAVPNGHIVEYVPWAWRLFHDGPRLEQGEIVLGDMAGHGLLLDRDFVQRHALR